MTSTKDLDAELVEAVKTEDLRAVTSLLDLGADPNTRAYAGYTYYLRTLGHDAPVLALAAYLGKLEIVQLLVEKGADVNGVCFTHLPFF